MGFGYRQGRLGRMPPRGRGSPLGWPAARRRAPTVPASRSALAMTSTSRARSSLTTFTGPSAASPATATWAPELAAWRPRSARSSWSASMKCSRASSRLSATMCSTFASRPRVMPTYTPDASNVSDSRVCALEVVTPWTPYAVAAYARWAWAVDVPARQCDRPWVLARASCVERPHGAVVADALDCPGLPVGDSQVAVVLARGDHVARTDGQFVVPGHGRRVVDFASSDTLGADAVVEGAGLVVGRDCCGDRPRGLDRRRGRGCDVLVGVGSVPPWSWTCPSAWSWSNRRPGCRRSRRRRVRSA